MKTLQLLLISGVGISIGIILFMYMINSQESINPPMSCSDPELKDLQYNPNLKLKQQVDLIALTNPEIKKIINASTYCQIMSISTAYTENGTYQDLNINLNNTKNLLVAINLKNNSVASYELVNLSRTYPAK